jgi:hypothetical protein
MPEPPVPPVGHPQLLDRIRAAVIGDDLLMAGPFGPRTGPGSWPPR